MTTFDNEARRATRDVHGRGFRLASREVMGSMRSWGIIGGSGWLGNAIADAAIATGFVEPSGLTLSGRSGARGKADLPGVRWTRDNQDLADSSQVIVVSVRPEQFPDVSLDARGKLVISVMAGVPARVLTNRLKSERIVRAMPNAAVGIRQSYTPWFACDAVSSDDKHLVQALFATCGTADEVVHESDLDYLTGLTGSGAAFPALLAEAMIAHAIAHGLPPDLARRAVRGVVVEASQLLAGDAFDPDAMVRAMIEYRGTTEAALRAMVDAGFKQSVSAGLDAAQAKAAAMAAASRKDPS